MLKIAVIGAGVGGLSAATLLARQGHNVTLFDQFDHPKPIGSGLVIQPVGQAVLEHLGALKGLRAKGSPIWTIRGTEIENNRTILDVSYGPEGGQTYGLAVHRGTLFLALLAQVPRSVTLVTNARIQQFDGKYVYSHDGKRYGPYALVVDSSGVNSRLSPLSARDISFGALWGTVDFDPSLIRPGFLEQRYYRASRMLGILPVGMVPNTDGFKATIFWSLPRTGYDGWKARGIRMWRREAEEIWPEFGDLLLQIIDPDQMTMTTYSHGTLTNPTGYRIAYIGDAAHRASPQLGQGANMALLDAMALARAIERNGPDVRRALRDYAAARRWHVRSYQMMSALFTPMYQSHSRVLPLVRDRVFAPLSRVKPMPSILTSMVRGDLLRPLGKLS